MDSVTGPRPVQFRPPRRTGGAGGGATGPAGPPGPAGVGVPPGGATGQVLEKHSGTDYDTMWATVTGGGGTSVTVGPTPPPAPVQGSLWWRNDPDGTLFVYYDDGTSQQFVPATPTTKGDPATGAYRYVQASAATSWVITHNLPFRPNVTAVDSTGRAIWPGALDYTSATVVTLTFSAAVGGEAYLS